MNYFVKENNNTSYINKLFIRVKVKDNIIELPNDLDKLYSKFKNNKISELYVKKIVNKLKKILKNNGTILSKKLKKNKSFIEKLEKENIKIYDGKWLYGYILKEIMEYILSEKREIKENTEVSFLVNFFDDVSVENIKIFAKQYKRVNIVTNHIEKLKKIEEDLYNENGIVITTSNNKRKSLANSKFIINIDFPNELINRYNICESAIIVNLEDRIKINKKRFNGIIINDYKIKFNNDTEIEDDYCKKEVFESNILKKDFFNNIRKEIEDNNVKICEIYGNNGKIKI